MPAEDNRRFFMPKTRSQKEETLKTLTEKVATMKSAIFVRQDGLNANDTIALRRLLREQQVEFVVPKKTLLKKALTDNGIESTLVDGFAGIVSAAFSTEDEVLPAKTLLEFSKKHATVKFLGAVVGKTPMTAEQSLAFAKLPGKKDLMGMLVSVVSSPLRGLVQVMQGNLRGLVVALKAIQEKKPA